MRVIKLGIADFTKEVTCPTCQAVLECTSQEMKYEKRYNHVMGKYIICSITCPVCDNKVPIKLTKDEEKVMDALQIRNANLTSEKPISEKPLTQLHWKYQEIGDKIPSLKEP